MTDEVLYLSRRNLLVLLAKLDANLVSAGISQCAIVKYQPPNMNVPFRQSMEAITIIAIEDEEFYSAQARAAGEMHPREEINLPKPSTGVYSDEPEICGMTAEVEVE